jgi:hypothetical protein
MTTAALPLWLAFLKILLNVDFLWLMASVVLDPRDQRWMTV